MSSTIDMSELLRDDSEIHDLLEAYGQEVPDKPKAARALLLECLEEVGETRLLSTLFAFAGGFAQMSTEVMGYCESKGVGIAGQMQVKTEEVFLDHSALNADWAFGGATTWDRDTAARANALAGEIGGLVDRFDPEDLLHYFEETHETEIGAFWRESSDARHQIYRDTMPHIAEQKRRYKAFAIEDYEAFGTITATLAETQSALAAAPLPAGVVSAFAELEARCRAVLEEMDATRMKSRGETSPAVGTLADEIHILSTQVRSLAEDVSEGQRAERGLGDFLRTDFWRHRWRIYELWLLVRVLEVLEQAGAEIHLLGVDKGVWHLRYGRASDPGATGAFAAGDVDVYYQLFEESDEGADMPDIVVRPQAGAPILVLDPKHGLSYSPGKVQEILDRYADHLEADLTAIVNYFPKRSYPFEVEMRGNRQKILASDVAPDSANARRLELRFQETLLARGYEANPGPAEVPVVRARRGPARAAYLFYWAGKAREVDEPAGPWIVPERGGPLPLPRVAEGLGERLQGIEATADGDACVLWTGEQLLFLQVGRQTPRPFGQYKGSELPAAWNTQGSRYLLDRGDDLLLFDRAGEQAIPVERPGGSRYNSAVGWEAGGKYILYAQKSGEDEVTLYRLTSLAWETVQVLKIPGASRYSTLTLTLLPLAPAQGTLLRAGRHVFLIRSTGAEATSEHEDTQLPPSPSGRYQVLDGPRSYREGVTLLTLRDTQEGTSLPYVRFFGERASELRWSPDESRLAFFAQQRSGRQWAEARLLAVRLGDKHALTVSMPGQEPSCFAWLSHRLVKPFLA